MGRLLKWHDLRNIAYFIARLNESLERELGNYANAYILNFDEIAAGFGRKFVQDDVLWQFNHGAALNDNDFEPDQARLHPPARASEHYTLRIGEFLHAVYEEVLAMHRTLRGKDAVKLVIVDLDDTLWRGVIVEEGSISNHTLEGWPLGFVEALLYLKKRGLLLAIVSKNDERENPCPLAPSVWPTTASGGFRGDPHQLAPEEREHRRGHPGSERAARQRRFHRRQSGRTLDRRDEHPRNPDPRNRPLLPYAASCSGHPKCRWRP